MNTPLPLGALAGCKVIDLSRVLGGPYCTQILADHGADVIKLEPMMGDETRGWGPPFHNGTSSYFVGINRNKQGMTIDLSQAAERQRLLDLLQEADVLVENFKPGSLEKWELGYQTLKQLFPRLIHCRITGFGADGPLGGLPGYDACAQAMCGLMSVNGDYHGSPTRIGLPVVDMVTGLNASIGILLAINERHHSGLGQFLDMTLYDCALSLLHPHASNYFYSGNIPQRSGNAHPNIAPYDSFSTQEGDLFLAIGNNKQFKDLMTKLGAPDVADDPRFVNNSDRLVHRDKLKSILLNLLCQHKAGALAETLLRSGIPASAVYTVDHILAHPHTTHRHMIWSHGGYQALGSPIKLSRTPARLRTTPPDLGQDNP